MMTMFENMLPYMSPDMQQKFNAMTQILELRQKISEYADRSGNWRSELLYSLQPMLPPESRRMIEVWVRLIEISDILSEMQMGGV